MLLKLGGLYFIGFLGFIPTEREKNENEMKLGKKNTGDIILVSSIQENYLHISQTLKG